MNPTRPQPQTAPSARPSLEPTGQGILAEVFRSPRLPAGGSCGQGPAIRHAGGALHLADQPQEEASLELLGQVFRNPVEKLPVPAGAANAVSLH